MRPGATGDAPGLSYVARPSRNVYGIAMTPRRLRTFAARRRMVQFAGAYLLEHLEGADYGAGRAVLERTRDALRRVDIDATLERLVEYHGMLDAVDGLTTGRYDVDRYLAPWEGGDRESIREGLIRGYEADVDLVEGLLVCA